MGDLCAHRHLIDGFPLHLVQRQAGRGASAVRAQHTTAGCLRLRPGAGIQAALGRS